MSRGDEKKQYSGPACAAAADEFFKEEVWGKVGVAKCLTCHKKGGDAEDSRFVLQDPRRVQGPAQEQAMRHNRDAFARMAQLKEKDQSRLLLKVVGQLKHGGKDVLKPDSAGYRILATFVRRVNAPRADVAVIDPKAPPFFDGVVMLDDRRLLRRLTLSLAGRLPTEVELAAVAKDGLKAMPAILDAVMKEDAFYARLREGFNDIFLTKGVDGNADQTVLSYEHFEKTRHWYQKFDLSRIKDENERRRAGYKLADDYRKALLQEPMRLIEHIVRNDRPFTEIVTADYIMVSPYTARGYGIFEQVKSQFKNPEDPFEYIPVQLKALVGRSKSENQDSATGFYPHAGVLSTFQYLTRYPTTETNRNRLRARMYYQHFLGVDVLELAARVSDAAAVTAKFKAPTMEASECVVCHKTLDPVAGLFQDYWRFADRGVYGKRKGGWFTGHVRPRLRGRRICPLRNDGERSSGSASTPRRTPGSRSPWSSTCTTSSPAARCCCRRRTWMKPYSPPNGVRTRNNAARSRRIATAFAQSGFNLKTAFKEWAASPFYRADGLATVMKNPKRRAELDDVGLVRMLSPEQVERKITAVFGQKWGRLTDQMAMLYGGIDSKEVTERATDPSGAMGAIQRIMSNDVACKNVAKDFARPAAERRLFPGIEPSIDPGSSSENDVAIRKAISFLHERILGRYDAADSRK